MCDRAGTLPRLLVGYRGPEYEQGRGGSLMHDCETCTGAGIFCLLPHLTGTTGYLATLRLSLVLEIFSNARDETTRVSMYKR
jgi:hypothetical protein